jgi:hypothetical protein
VESAHRVFVGGLEREMVFPIGSHAGAVGDPKCRFAIAAVPDGPAEIHLSRESEHTQHSVVERLGFRVVGAVDPDVVDHGKDPGTIHPHGRRLVR